MLTRFEHGELRAETRIHPQEGMSQILGSMVKEVAWCMTPILLLLSEKEEVLEAQVELV
jgi:hypothetical protein